jgi:hypothetical protein
MRFAPVADAQKAVHGRELEVLHALRIDWTGARTHIRCPFPNHTDRHPSWRWDSGEHRAFCTCTPHALSIFDTWMRIKSCGFAEACTEVMLAIGRTDLVRDTDAKKKTKDAIVKPGGCTLSQLSQAKGLPIPFLLEQGLRDIAHQGVQAVEIPYRGTGSVRYRTALEKPETGPDLRFKWKAGSKAVPYGQDHLSLAREKGYCVLAEGETDTLTLRLHDFPALGIPGATTWQDDRDAVLLNGIDTIFLCAEPDEGGAAFLKRFARSTLRPRLQIIHFDEDGPKDPNALYLLDRDGFGTAMQAKLDAAVVYTPPPREPRDQPRDDDRPGQPLELIDREPWPEPVESAELIDEVIRQIKRYVVIGDDAVIATALWVAASYCFDIFHIFPRLLVTAPTKRAGKSTLMGVVRELVNRPLAAINIAPAAMFRTIDVARPTLLLDEADSFIRDNEALRGILNGGHERSGTVIRTVETGRKGDYRPRTFSVFSPIALAAIGRLHGTIEDRSIVINLQRRRRDELVDSFRAARVGDLNVLGRKIARFVTDNGVTLMNADPVMPDVLFSRDADNWMPLLAIADVAGGIWPGLAREAAERLIETDDREDRLTSLLSDIRDAFDRKNTDLLETKELLEILLAREDRLYADQKLTANKLGIWLSKAKLPKAEQVWTDGRNARCYRRAKFEDAFTRYLRPRSGG